MPNMIEVILMDLLLTLMDSFGIVGGVVPVLFVLILTVMLIELLSYQFLMSLAAHLVGKI